MDRGSDLVLVGICTMRPESRECSLYSGVTVMNGCNMKTKLIPTVKAGKDNGRL